MWSHFWHITVRAELQRDLGCPHGRMVQSEEKQEVVLSEMCPFQSVGGDRSFRRRQTTIHVRELSGSYEKNVHGWSGWLHSTFFVALFRICWAGICRTGFTTNGARATGQRAFHEAIAFAGGRPFFVCLEVYAETLPVWTGGVKRTSQR